MPARSPIVVRVAALLMVGALVSTSCSDSDDAAPPTSIAATTTSTIEPRADDGVLKVGVLLPATGPGETLGTPMRVAVEAGIALINESGGVLGSDVQYAEADESTTSGMQDLLDDGVDAIIGPASSLVALSQLATAVSSPNGVVVCSPSATALSLDDFPDNGYFFRTAPSDSLQMEAIARQAERTGEATATIAYLDDPYGRGLAGAVAADIAEGDPVLELVNQVPFSGDLEDLSGPAATVLADSPGVIILLADADDGGRFLAALDEQVGDGSAPQIVLNDSIRTARQAISSLRPSVRMQITGVAPASASIEGGPEGAFAGQAVDCLNLIALAVQQSESDAPREFRREIAAVTAVGQLCDSFDECSELLRQDLQIDYNGLSGNIDLSGTTGDRTRATFDRFLFEADGTERPLDPPIFMP